MMKQTSLNPIYQLICDAHLRQQLGQQLRVPPTSFIAALFFSSALFCNITLAEPTGGVVTGGIGTISQNGAVTTINQNSQVLNLNWNTFNVAAHETVNFVQPSSTALAINQILDTNGSRILGNINANGQVWLINPNGVFFGQGSQVNVGALLASTLNPLSNSTDNTQVFGNGGTGSVINQGSIVAANGGYVAFVGNTVSNQGSISANRGTVGLAGGSHVTLTFADNQLYKIDIDQSTLNNLAENKQLIQANGGAVLLSAGAKQSVLASVVNNEGIIEAQTIENKEGKIILLAGMEAGTTNVAGTLDASAQTGNGGFIETSGAKVKIADSVNLTTKAHNVDNGSGKNGTWLIDPHDFTIAASGGDISGSTLSTALQLNDVTIQTLLASVNCTGAACGAGNAAGNGDIFVNDTISWSSNQTLTLSAFRNININQTITATGAAGRLNLEYGQGTNDGVIGPTPATYNVNAKVNLQAGDNFSTKLGLTGPLRQYKVITSLGLANTLNTGTDLQGVNNAVFGGNFVLGADIDASATSGWINPAPGGGTGFRQLVNYTGTFDGLGHTISNLYINQPTSGDAVGLFREIFSSGRVQNVSLTNVQMIGGSVVGGIVGSNYGGTINNVRVSGTVTGDDEVGGLVGRNGGQIINSSFTGTVSPVGADGGLVGILEADNDGTIFTGTITNSTVTLISPNTLQPDITRIITTTQQQYQPSPATEASEEAGDDSLYDIIQTYGCSV